MQPVPAHRGQYELKQPFILLFTCQISFMDVLVCTCVRRESLCLKFPSCELFASAFRDDRACGDRRRNKSPYRRFQLIVRSCIIYSRKFVVSCRGYSLNWNQGFQRRFSRVVKTRPPRFSRTGGQQTPAQDRTSGIRVDESGDLHCPSPLATPAVRSRSS